MAGPMYNRPMKRLGIAVVVAACTHADPNAVQTYAFGPFQLDAEQEITDQCVQISLNNATDLYVNQVEFKSGPGLHHSNWFYVPDRIFAGDDGVYTCADRSFDTEAAAVYGGVLFAQSTQATHDVQQFPDGGAIKIPKGSKLVAQIHLLNATDSPLTISPTIAITPIAEVDVTTHLAALSFEDQALGLPPNMQSSFTVDCDLGPLHQQLFGRAPDFNIYYALAHYHALGTGMTVSAVSADGATVTPVFQTTAEIGDSLGSTIDPIFPMTGYSRIRFTCDYFNSTSQTVVWGVGNQEMCVFLAFTDSTYQWGGGDPNDEAPGNPLQVGNVMTFSNSCSVFANDNEH